MRCNILAPQCVIMSDEKTAVYSSDGCCCAPTEGAV